MRLTRTTRSATPGTDSTRSDTPSPSGRPSVAEGTARIAICMWRDLRHPEGGGSELYVETVARELAAAGNEVTILCAAVAGHPARERVDGVDYRRAGGRYGVYLRAALTLATRRVRPDVVVDVQNGIPFLTTLVTRRPVVALVHHVHKEQWPMVFGPVLGRVGWMVESRVAPWLYRDSRYLTVCEATRAELADQGVAPDRVAVAYNGTPPPATVTATRSLDPRLVVLGRLVPHKRVEIAIRTAARLRPQHPRLRVDVVGQGWWSDKLRAVATELGVDDIVTFHGYVEETTKAELLSRAWLSLVPSAKEGWGLGVVEAATYGTASVAFADAGGLSESIEDGDTGLLVDGDEDAYVDAVGRLLADVEECRRLGRRARRRAASYTWEATAAEVTATLDASITGVSGSTAIPTIGPAIRPTIGSRPDRASVTILTAPATPSCDHQTDQHDVHRSEHPLLIASGGTS